MKSTLDKQFKQRGCVTKRIVRQRPEDEGLPHKINWKDVIAEHDKKSNKVDSDCPGCGGEFATGFFCDECIPL